MATGGLKSKNQELLDEVKKARDGLKSWEGVGDPEQVRQVMSRIAQDEETRLISEGKVDEVITRRVGRMRDDYEARLKAAQDAQTGVVQERDQYRQRYHRTVLDTSVQRAAADAGILPSAVEDVLHRASSVFTLENDQPVARDSAGVLLIGKDGRTPLTVGEWLASIKERTPHWWPAPSGSGSSGSRGRGTGGSSGQLTEEEIGNLSMSDYRKLRAEGRI